MDSQICEDKSSDACAGDNEDHRCRKMSQAGRDNVFHSAHSFNEEVLVRKPKLGDLVEHTVHCTRGVVYGHRPSQHAEHGWFKVMTKDFCDFGYVLWEPKHCKVINEVS